MNDLIVKVLESLLSLLRFLGVSLTKVLLASRDKASKKPILVVCKTNHALDSFLDDLRKSGVMKLVRLGGNSKELWTKDFQISNVSRNMKRTTFERTSLALTRSQIDGLSTEGTSWCESLNSQSLSWPAVREHLRSRYPDTLRCFTALEQIEDAKIADIRLARKAGGFAFEYWCHGGDIRDIDSLVQHFSSLLGNTVEFQDDADDEDIGVRSRVLDKVFWNADAIARSDVSSETEVWRLSLADREALLQRWKVEIDPQTILDRTAEIHRRHQVAVAGRRTVLHDIDARFLAQREYINRAF